MIYHLQSRWVPRGGELVYYGLRGGKNMFRNTVRLTKRQRSIIDTLPRELSKKELRALRGLVGTQIVTEDALRRVPRGFDEATFCRGCCANDFIIPGLEFDENGLCPMCRNADNDERLRSLVPLVTDIPRAKGSRFDVALFYTGGKDSTYLLYYLSKVKNLRVLALTWEIPFMSPNARQSIENAKQRLENVEFITRSISTADMRRIYAKLYELSENTCACPSLAYVLFYPDLVAERVPYFLAGNEPVQVLGLYYNHMAPRFAYSFAQSGAAVRLLNAGRLLTLRPPLKKGQFHTLQTMKQLVTGNDRALRASGYQNELVSNIVRAIHEVPQIVEPLRRAVKYSSRTGRIPAFVQIDLDAISGGRYDWNSIKKLIVAECGWVAPDASGKALHTSCTIERCKEYSQFIRFYECRSRMIPFSALEISLASRGKNITRAEAAAEMKEQLGFSLEPVEECAIMRGFLSAAPNTQNSNE